MLEIIKELLNINIGDTNKDNILNFYINKAENVIRNYLNFIDEEWIIEEIKFENPIVDLAIFFYKHKDDVGVTQQSQGSRSITLKDGIPDSIKSTLPLPRIKVVG